jgi:hypothetical protein
MEPWVIVIPVAIIVALVMIARKVSKTTNNHESAVG